MIVEREEILSEVNMRKLVLSLGMAFCCLCCNAAFASSASSDELNARIKSLQERLKQFQNRSYADSEEKLVVEEEAIDLILDREAENILPPSALSNLSSTLITDETVEQLVEDFEKRSDVALTVLFHDSESDNFYVANKEFFAAIEPPKVIIETEQESKQRFYDSLRQRVFNATRKGKSDPEDIRQQLAKLDSL